MYPRHPRGVRRVTAICIVNEAYYGALSEACKVQEHRLGDEAFGHNLDEVAVGEDTRKDIWISN